MSDVNEQLDRIREQKDTPSYRLVVSGSKRLTFPCYMHANKR